MTESKPARHTVTIHYGDGRPSQTVETTPWAEAVNVVDVESSDIQNLSGRRAKSIGHCIYCGATTDLRREHVIPYALNGDLVLLDASCGRCARITSLTEQTFLRGSAWPVRPVAGLRSRSQHEDAPETVRVVGKRNGVSVELDVPRGQVALLPLPLFAVPGVLRNGRSGCGRTQLSAAGIEVNGVVTLSFGADPDKLSRDLGLEQVSIVTSPDHPVSFARMIAKIAHAFAYAEGLIQRPHESLLVPAILGESDDVGMWVGTMEGQATRLPPLLHALRVQEGPEFLVIGVQFFASTGAPTYGALVRKLND